jgi:hypothetical protein
MSVIDFPRRRHPRLIDRAIGQIGQAYLVIWAALSLMALTTAGLWLVAGLLGLPLP